MPHHLRASLLCLSLALAGCGRDAAIPPIGGPMGKSDPERARSADYSILFVGNSHTSTHDVPGVVSGMIQHLEPGKTVYTHVLPVAFLEDTATDARANDEIDNVRWTHVVLQAQKISMSGKEIYSATEGIDLAKRAQARGAAVYFFSEWSRKGVDEEGPRTERIYQGMAEASGARVIPIGRAWDRALARRPELGLHAVDGNHESALGAYLTSCVITSTLTGRDPTPLATFDYPNTDESLRRFLVEAAIGK